MIGLKFPRLFYGRKKRQRAIGNRADFCEFCLCVSRHQVISFESAQTVMFVSAAYEEFDRESHCEICRTPFPASTRHPVHSGSEVTIEELIRETNPTALQDAQREFSEMTLRADDFSTLEKNRVINFLRSHENEYRRRLRGYVPLIAVGSIQAMILGLVLSVWIDFWLALAFVGAIYLLCSLVYFMWLRQNTFAAFQGGAQRLKQVSGWEYPELRDKVLSNAHRFPKAVDLVCKQIDLAEQADEYEFTPGKDFIPLNPVSG